MSTCAVHSVFNEILKCVHKGRNLWRVVDRQWYTKPTGKKSMTGCRSWCSIQTNLRRVVDRQWYLFKYKWNESMKSFRSQFLMLTNETVENCRLRCWYKYLSFAQGGRREIDFSYWSLETLTITVHSVQTNWRMSINFLFKWGGYGGGGERKE